MPWIKVEPMNQRKEFVLKAIQSRNFRQLCQEYGISTKTGYKWRERFYQHGLEGMMEQPRRPLSHAKELAEAVICEIIRLKNAHPHWGARKLRDIYQARAVSSGYWSGLGWWRSDGSDGALRQGGSAQDAKPALPMRSGR